MSDPPVVRCLVALVRNTRLTTRVVPSRVVPDLAAYGWTLVGIDPVDEQQFAEWRLGSRLPPVE